MSVTSSKGGKVSRLKSVRPMASAPSPFFGRPFSSSPARSVNRLLTPRTCAAGHPSSLLRTVLSRELGAVHVSRRILLDSLCCDEERDAYVVGPAPPFAAQFAPGSRTVAVGDEDGFVTIVDTAQTSSAGTGNTIQLACHANAIFDLSWVPGRNELLTSSGDQTVRLFDVRTQAQTRCFRGHQGSVKTISSLDASTFASGGRDGNICVWDGRLPEARPALVVANAHDVHAPGKRKRSGVAQGTQAGGQSVSCVCFIHDDVAKLATAGASDGAIKIWDLRALSTGTTPAARGASKARVPAPFHTLRPTVQDSGRPRGITSLAIDASGSRLLATTTNSIIHMYDTRWCATRRDSSGTATAAASPARAAASSRAGGGDGGASESVAQFSGHRVDSFYVKTCFSPDGRHILSGSSDSGVYVWEAARPSVPPVVLWGHATEVTAVAWCPADFNTLVSASDDAALRVWRVDREGGQAAQQVARLRHGADQSPTSTTNAGGAPELAMAPAEGETRPAAASSSTAVLPSPSDSVQTQPTLGAQRDASLRSWLVSRAALDEDGRAD